MELFSILCELKKSTNERGVSSLVIYYIRLNKIQKWIRYQILNKKDILIRLDEPLIFSNFDLKSAY